jgi:hypothetical protein
MKFGIVVSSSVDSQVNWSAGSWTWMTGLRLERASPQLGAQRFPHDRPAGVARDLGAFRSAAPEFLPAANFRFQTYSSLKHHASDPVGPHAKNRSGIAGPDAVENGRGHRAIRVFLVARVLQDVAY